MLNSPMTCPGSSDVVDELGSRDLSLEHGDSGIANEGTKGTLALGDLRSYVTVATVALSTTRRA